MLHSRSNKQHKAYWCAVGHIHTTCAYESTRMFRKSTVIVKFSFDHIFSLCNFMLYDLFPATVAWSYKATCEFFWGNDN